MRVAKGFGVICCALLLSIGWANVAVAGDGDVLRGGSEFNSDKKIKANKGPILWSVMSIPPDIVPGVVFQVDCQVEAKKNDKDAPQKAVKGSVASFAILLDVGSRTWDFVGLVGSGISFKTKKNGKALLTTGPVTAGAWANNPSDNDTISLAATITSKQKIKKTSFGCEIVVGE